ncbi:MAG: MarR family transcriptional regulator [Ignavibacteriales bacterium]|nr:MarR family transcriptional regulator [Ignavibacteriales bacterium]
MNNLKEAINYLSALIDNVVEETMNQFDFNDLTHQQLRYLRVIVRMKNPSISELATELKLTKPTVTVLVDKLTAKGYVKRVQSDKDKRSQHLHLAKKGMKINTIMEIAHERMAKILRSGLSETETAILIKLLRKTVRCN